MECLQAMLINLYDEESANYIINMVKVAKSEDEVVESLQDFLDMSNQDHRRILEEVIQWKENILKKKGKHNQSLKMDICDEKGYQVPAQPKQKKQRDNYPTMKADDNVEHTFAKGKGDGRRSKPNFVPLFTESGQKTAVTIPGRHSCDCLATKHGLINNCLSCGRIVCTQEGSGPCFFCGELVCTPEEKEKIDRQSKKGDKLRQQLMNQVSQSQSNGNEAVNDSLSRTISHKNKLLEFDRTSAKRTRVIDDELDYYATDNNVWLNEAEKNKIKAKEEQLREARFASRLSRPMKITLDLAGRKMIEEDSVAQASQELYAPENEEYTRNVTLSKNKHDHPEFINDELPKISIPRPNITDYSQAVSQTKSVSMENKRREIRLQDSELQELRDEGLCLSMHQPYASLLVEGIKLHEGRSWYSKHRGRLWIASTAKPCSSEDVGHLKNFYIHRGVPVDSFPVEYPSGCLLGCVDVINCLSHEEYKEKYPDGESDCPFVFVCANPKSLHFKLPMKGQHKIYKLERHIHEAAKKGIQ